MTPAAQRIRVAIADDHAMVREGLRSLLRAGEFEVVGEASTGREAVELVLKERPQVVLMDVRMPDMDGLAALSRIKEETPSSAVLMVTTYEDASYLVRAIAAGAAGYLLKGVGREELVEALRAVASGESVIDPSMLRTVVESVAGQGGSGAMAGSPSPLTEREEEVLQLVAQGLTNNQIGEKLFITEGTARAHIHNILQKLGLSDRTQAAVWAAKKGLLS